MNLGNDSAGLRSWLHRKWKRLIMLQMPIAIQWLIALKLLIARQSLLVFPGWMVVVSSPSLGQEDLLPIRRILLPAHKPLPAELDKARKGPLVTLPYEEFEALVRQATRAEHRQKQPPRLAAAYYHAELSNGGLIGSGHWQIQHDGPGPAVLNLEPMAIALRSAQWKVDPLPLALVAGGAATQWRRGPPLIGQFDDLRQAPGLELLIETPGTHELEFTWSAGMIPLPGETRIDLRFPPCAVAIFDLDLPNDRKPELLQKDALIQGPTPSPHQANRSRWRIAFGGLTQLDLSIRKPNDPDQPPPLVRWRLRSQQTLALGQVQCVFDFEFESLHAPIDELQLECDPRLLLTDVLVNQRDSWSRSPGATPQAPQKVQVKLREPLTGGKLEVHALMPLTVEDGSASWRSPWAWLLKGVPRGETLELRIHPELQPEEWKAGGFRLVRTATDATGHQLLSLQTGLASTANEPWPRPTTRLATPGPEYRVLQHTDWTIEADRSRLTSQLTIEPTRGTLYQIRLALPNDYDLEHLEANPRDLLADTTIEKNVLVIDLAKPLTTGTTLPVTLHLKGAAPKLPLHCPAEREPIRVTLPFPEVTPLGRANREGDYRIRVSSAFRASAMPAPWLSEHIGISWLPLAKFRRERETDTVFHYQHRGQSVEGALLLSSRPLRLVSSCDSTVSVFGERVRVRSQLTLDPKAGTLSEVILRSTAPASVPWTWRPLRGNNSVETIQPLPQWKAMAMLSVLASRTPWQGLSTWAAVQSVQGNWWKLKFLRPLQEPLVLEAVYEPLFVSKNDRAAVELSALLAACGPLSAVAARGLTTLAPLPTRWPVSVPLPVVLEAERHEGTVTIERSPSDRTWMIQPFGMQPNPSRPDSFRYGSAPFGLMLDRGEPVRSYAQARMDGAVLAVTLEPEALRCQFQLRVAGWPEREFRLRLTAEATVVSARVDGRDDPSMVRIERGPLNVVVLLPVDGQADWQWIEVVYRLPRSRGWPSETLSAPAPEPAVPLRSLRRYWLLPPGVGPRDPQRYEPLPGNTAAVGLPALPAQWRRELRELLGELPTERPLLPTGELGDGSLAERLIRWATRPGNSDVLIVDTEALRELQLRPHHRPALHPAAKPSSASTTATTTPPTAPAAVTTPSGATSAATTTTPATVAFPWEAFGLTAQPVGSAILLTTPRQLSVWQVQARQETEDLPRSLQAALTQATRAGHDATGRFRTLADWLQDADVSLGNAPRDWLHLPAGWTLWRDDLGRSTCVVTETRSLARASWVLSAILLGVSGAIAYRTRRLGKLLLLVWIGLAGCAYLTLPLGLRELARGPLLTGLIVAAALVLLAPRLAQPRIAASGSSRLIGTAMRGAAALLLLIAGGALSQTQAPASAPEGFTVWLLPRAADDPTPTTVLAPLELIDRLRTLAQPPLPTPAAMVLEAHYEGQLGDVTALFEARYLVAVTRPGPVRLPLPLSGIQLRDAQIDRQPAFPQGNDLTFSFFGEGIHELIVKFAVNVIGSGGDREVRFGLPEVIRSRLSFDAPRTARQLSLNNWRGAQRLVEQPNRFQLEADLGRSKLVQIRWRDDGSNPTPPLVRVQEVGLWEIDESSASLLTVFNYRVSQGSVSRLEAKIPSGLEVARIAVTPLDPPLGIPAAWIRNWRLAADRNLRIDLQTPLTGRIKLTLELTPTQPLTATPTLNFASALGAAEAESFAAFRLAPGLELGPELERRSASDFPTEAFHRDHWLPANFGRAAGPPTRAFQRTSTVEPMQIRLQLQPVSPPTQGKQELNWQLDPRIGLVQAKAQWSGASAGLTLVEWEVPSALKIVEVRGAELRTWSRAGNRVQAWLQRPLSEVALFWTGTLPLSGRSVEGTFFDLSAIRMWGVASQETILRLSASLGWQLRTEDVQQIQPLAAPVGCDWHGKTDQSTWQLRAVLLGPQSEAVYRLLSAIQIDEQRFRMQTQIEVLADRRKPHRFQITVPALPQAEWRWELPADCSAEAEAELQGRKRWTIRIPSRPAGPLHLTLQVVQPTSAATAKQVQVPELQIWHGTQSVGRIEHWLGLGEGELVEAVGVRSVTALPAGIGQGGSEKRFPWGTAPTPIGWWQVRSENWRMRVQPNATRSEPRATVRIAWAEFESAKVPGQRWMHRGLLRLYCDERASFAVQLPIGAEWESLAWDGEMQASEGNRWTPANVAAGIHTLQVQWSFPASAENEHRPNLEPLLLETPSEKPLDVPAIWTVYQPPGERLEPVPTPALSSSMRLFRRAEAELRLARWSRTLASEPTGNDPTASHGTEDWLRLGELRWTEARLSGWPTADTSPDGQPLADWLARLRAEQKTLWGADAPRSATWPSLWQHFPHAEAFREGVPVRWLTNLNAPPPTLHATAVDVAMASLLRWTRGSLWALGVFGLAIFLWAGSVFRPEVLLTLGVLGAFIFGLAEGGGLLGISLLGIGWRLGTILRWLWSRPR